MRRSSVALAVAAVVATILPASAEPLPGLPGEAGGGVASSNVEFVANVPVPGGAAGARILGDTMYVTGSGGLTVYDLSLGVPAPVATLPLPHFGNEDVDTNGEILLISADNMLAWPTVMLYVIDVAPKAGGVIAPVLLSAWPVDDGHTVSCINDCSYAWLAGSRDVYVVDLQNPAAPKVIGSFNPGVGGTHDVQVDDEGIAWVVGGDGIAGFTTADPLRPVEVVRQGSPRFHNKFILHNSLRPHAADTSPATFGDDQVDTGELVLVTEENWLSVTNGLCADDGHFQTGHYRERNGVRVLEKLDSINLGSLVMSGDRKPVSGFCSSHYFDYRDDDIVAVGWYEQGVRFMDVSNPRDIRQIGYYMPAATAVWSTKWHGDYLYTLDYVRGIDVLRFTGGPGAQQVLAPYYNEPPVAVTGPSEDWGYLCKIPLVG